MKIKPLILAAGALALMPMSFANCVGVYCTFSYGGLSDEWCAADCNTFTETKYISPITGSAVDHTELITTSVYTNCASTAVSHTFNYTYTESESISHSGTGVLKDEVIAKVGAKDVGEVGLSHATENTTTRIYTDNWTHSISTAVTQSVAACTTRTLKLFGIYRTGAFSGSGRVDYTVTARHCFVIDYQTVSGECADTQSQVASSHKHYKTTHLVGSSSAASPTICQNGCKPQAEAITVGGTP